MRNAEPWDVVDPARVLTDVLRRVTAEPDAVFVAMLRTGEHQELVNVAQIHVGAPLELHDASELLRRHARSVAGDRPWEGSGWRRPQFLFVTVVCRRGRVIPSAQDYFWLTAWRYSNHCSNAFDGDIYLVTEHGWSGCVDRRAGFAPHLGAGTSDPPLAVVRDS